MTVKLDVNNDEELRLWIKDLVRGQIKSVVRDEIKLIVSEMVGQKIEKVSAIADIDKVITSVIDQKVATTLKGSYYGDDFIKTTAKELITAKVGEILRNLK